MTIILISLFEAGK